MATETEQQPDFNDVLFFMPKSVARRRLSEDQEFEKEKFEREHVAHLTPWAHKHINGLDVHKLKKYFVHTLDVNNDGVINWADFEQAIEAMVPQADAEKNSRLKVLRKSLEKDFAQYFRDLCEKGDINQDGNIDIEEWLDVMDEIIYHLKKENTFPEWYTGLIKVLFRSHEFMDKDDASRDEFINLLSTWDFDGEPAGKAYDYITKNGEKKMDYPLFEQFMREFLTNNEQGHPVNCGLDM
jgi:Ca2+-binding EF-hand superfamily protein